MNELKKNLNFVINDENPREIINLKTNLSVVRDSLLGLGRVGRMLLGNLF